MSDPYNQAYPLFLSLIFYGYPKSNKYHEKEREIMLADNIHLIYEKNSLLEKQIQELTRELNVTKEKIEITNQEKQRFITNIRHELRSLLSVILGFSQLLLDDNTLSKEQHEHSNIIKHSAGDILTLINSVAFASQQPIHRDDKPLVESKNFQQLNAQYLQIMPQAWLLKLSDAVLEANIEQVMQLILEIPSTETILIESISKLTKQFQFEQLLNLIESCLNADNI